jgi:hypothetical protein
MARFKVIKLSSLVVYYEQHLQIGEQQILKNAESLSVSFRTANGLPKPSFQQNMSCAVHPFSTQRWPTAINNF